MKSHPHLLLRDALAGVFVRAATGDREADEILDDLSVWADAGRTSQALLSLSGEDGVRLFAPNGGLAPTFRDLVGYARDRARRFRAARDWIREAGAEALPLERARAAWDAGLFFEVHEILEPVWMREEGPRRELLQGLIMAGAALHHLVSSNLAGARGLLREAARRLEKAPRDGPLELESFARDLARLADRIQRGEVRGPDDIDQIPALRVRAG